MKKRSFLSKVIIFSVAFTMIAGTVVEAQSAKKQAQARASILAQLFGAKGKKQTAKQKKNRKKAKMVGLGVGALAAGGLAAAAIKKKRKKKKKKKNRNKMKHQRMMNGGMMMIPVMMVNPTMMSGGMGMNPMMMQHGMDMNPMMNPMMMGGMGMNPMMMGGGMGMNPMMNPMMMGGMGMNPMMNPMMMQPGMGAHFSVMGPQGTQPSMKKALIGAGLGAGLGALASRLTGKNLKKGALAGALGGGVLGGLSGNLPQAALQAGLGMPSIGLQGGFGLPGVDLQGGSGIPGINLQGGLGGCPTAGLNLAGALPTPPSLCPQMNQGRCPLSGAKGLNPGLGMNPMMMNPQLSALCQQAGFGGLGLGSLGDYDPSNFPCERCTDPNFNALTGGRCHAICVSTHKLPYSPELRRVNDKVMDSMHYPYRRFDDRRHSPMDGYYGGPNDRYNSTDRYDRYSGFRDRRGDFGDGYSRDRYGSGDPIMDRGYGRRTPYGSALPQRSPGYDRYPSYTPEGYIPPSQRTPGTPPPPGDRRF